MAITPEQLFTTLPSVLKTAPIQYRNSLYTDPALYRSYYGELPPYMQWAEGKDGWGMDEFGSYNPDLLNSDNLDVVGYDKDGNFQVKLKTGDKEGSIYTYAKQPDGTFKLQGGANSSQYWDTNQGLLEDPIALAMMLGVGAIAGGGIGAASGLWSDPLAAGTGSGGLLGSGGAGVPIAENVGAGALVPNSAIAESFPIAAYGPELSTAMAPLPGITAAVGSGAGATLPGLINSAAAGAGAATGAATGAAGAASSLLGSLPDSLKWIAPLVLGGLTAYETKNANGEVNAYGPSMDKYNSLLGRQWTQPNFTTGLMPPPAPKKYY